MPTALMRDGMVCHSHIILQGLLPGGIHRPGSVFLRHLGEGQYAADPLFNTF